jgi:hypothetical protein
MPFASEQLTVRHAAVVEQDLARSLARIELVLLLPGVRPGVPFSMMNAEMLARSIDP